eukprot:scaffold1032_cov223-Pinguiococcus_pyrenoidosus.AAC.5
MILRHGLVKVLRRARCQGTTTLTDAQHRLLHPSSKVQALPIGQVAQCRGSAHHAVLERLVRTPANSDVRMKPQLRPKGLLRPGDVLCAKQLREAGIVLWVCTEILRVPERGILAKKEQIQHRRLFRRRRLGKRAASVRKRCPRVRKGSREVAQLQIRHQSVAHGRSLLEQTWRGNGSHAHEPCSF